MPVEGMAANRDKITRSETILKAELSTLPRQEGPEAPEAPEARLLRLCQPVPQAGELGVCGVGNTISEMPEVLIGFTR